MFKMVTVLIAVALMAVVALAGFYYGGKSMNGNRIEAEAARYRNEGQQIASSVALFRAQGNSVTSEFKLQDLVDGGYLKALPPGWRPSSDVIKKQLDPDSESSEHICYRANAQSGFTFASSESHVEPYSLDSATGIPSCDKPNLPNQVPCCVDLNA